MRSRSLKRIDARPQEELRGKLSYSAPEQLLGRDLTSSLDLFALGILLAEVALGVHPFASGENALERQLKGELPGLATARPDLPPAFLALVQGLLEPTLERRCPSAAAALAQLRALSWDAEAARREVARLAQDERDGNEETTRPADTFERMKTDVTEPLKRTAARSITQSIWHVAVQSEDDPEQVVRGPSMRVGAHAAEDDRIERRRTSRRLGHGFRSEGIR